MYNLTSICSLYLSRQDTKMQEPLVEDVGHCRNIPFISIRCKQKYTTLVLHMTVRTLETVYVYYLTRESRIKPIKNDPFMPTKRDKKRNKKCKLENTVKRESVKKRAKRKIVKKPSSRNGRKTISSSRFSV